MPTVREIAAFEAGIKLGALYHQFVGTPVSRKTARSLEQAIVESISLQPHVLWVRVTIDRRMLEENVYGYGELLGKMIEAEVMVEYEGARARAKLAFEPEMDYPMMRLLETEGDGPPNLSSRRKKEL